MNFTHASNRVKQPGNSDGYKTGSPSRIIKKVDADTRYNNTAIYSARLVWVFGDTGLGSLEDVNSSCHQVV